MSDIEQNPAQRWSNSQSHVDYWKHRTYRLAEWISSDSRVIEIGCGKQAITDVLDKSISYLPTDAFPLDPSVHILDLNRPATQWRLPGGDNFDYLVSSGVLEYLLATETAIEWFSTRVNTILCSYLHPEPCGMESIDERINAGFKNHYSIGQLNDLFEQFGYKRVETGFWHGHRLYKFSSL